MLRKKMLRDISKNFSQFITIFLMIMIGIMAFSGIKAYMNGMQKTVDKFYSENNIYDLVAIGNLDREDLKTIKRIDNVNDAEAKFSVKATTNNDKILLLNFIESNNISKFHIFKGEEFNKNKKGIWLDNYYCEKNNIKVGDTVLVKYETIELHEKVLGIINVPDHLYDTRDKSELYPSRKEFGIAYISTNEIPEEYIKSLVMKEINIKDEKKFEKLIPNFEYKKHIPFSSIMIDVKDKSKRDDIKNEIEDKVKNVKGILNLEDTISYITYQGEIDEGKTYVGVFSGIFICIAMLSVTTTMTRVIKKQRTQIGTLKALGFSNKKILLNYIEYGIWTSVTACILGLILGYYLIGNIFMNLEMSLFEIPNGIPYMSVSSYYVSVIVVIFVALIIYITGRSILKENPAEALRTKIPKVNGNMLNITKNKFLRKLNFSTKWNIRDILRNKLRTFIGFIGVASCCALMVCALGMLDSMNYFVKLQFEEIYNFKYKLELNENIKNDELEKIYKKYGNSTSKNLEIEIINNKNKREANNIFITDAEDYVRFLDNRNEIKQKPADNGIYITYKLAKTKGYDLGDEIKWHIYGDKKYYTSKIIGFNKDPQNQNISMSKKYFESLGFKYTPDALYTNIDLKNIKNINNVETIQHIDDLKSGMSEMLSQMKSMLIIIIVTAAVLGAIIIYNLGVLSYTEKEYQFATLKVLGFKDKKIKNIFIKQNNWIAVVSIIVGLPSGFYLTDWLFKTAIEEHYDFGAHINLETYIISAIGTFLISYLVSNILARKIEKIDMVTSLKGNE